LARAPFAAVLITALFTRTAGAVVSRVKEDAAGMGGVRPSATNTTLEAIAPPINAAHQAAVIALGKGALDGEGEPRTAWLSPGLPLQAVEVERAPRVGCARGFADGEHVEV
jgi:hypothetical protein